ncbi:hypothetical protein EJB05_09451, partial [Eragrostis curvula]
MRAEYAHCHNQTIIDTQGEPENMPDEIKVMLTALVNPLHRLLMFLQHSNVEWCSSLSLDTVIDPTFRCTIVVISKFDNRLKEFGKRTEDRHGTVSNEEFWRQICHVDIDVLCHFRENVEEGFNEEKYGPYIEFGCLKKYLESELQKWYKEAAPTTLSTLAAPGRFELLPCTSYEVQIRGIS